MYLKQLHYFVTLADTGSFTKAAGIHYIVQTSMSQQISSLEKELGIQLFARTTRKVELTAAGKAFYDEIKPLVIKLDDAISGAKRIADINYTRIEIGIDQDIDNSNIISVIKRFSEEYPGVTIKIMVDMADRLFETLTQNNCDLVIMSNRNQSQDRNLVKTVLGSEPESLRSVVIPDTEISENVREVSWEDICHRNVLLYSSMPDPIRNYKDRLILDSMLEKPVTVVSNTESLRIMVCAGLGVGVIPRRMESRFGKGVCVVPLKSENIKYEKIVSFRSKNNAKRETVSFLNMLAEAYKKQERLS